jgi:hypothetical protein
MDTDRCGVCNNAKIDRVRESKIGRSLQPIGATDSTGKRKLEVAIETARLAKNRLRYIRELKRGATE